MSLVRDGFSVSAASRELGVSRQTAYLWLHRAEKVGLDELSERSRRPVLSPEASSPEVVDQVLLASHEHPYWGARKLHALLWPEGSAPVSSRTVGRILQRHGRTHNVKKAVSIQRFERAAPNELWQADFKKLGSRRNRAETFNVLDDATRFCVLSEIVPDQTLDSLWSVLWEAFGNYGLPDAMLTDNGPAFRCNATWRWSSFDLKLMLLGIRACHGRPYHPQTQGKVERFHGTLERELGEAFLHNNDLIKFRDRYNWIRPHEALEMKTPGTVYWRSTRQRPDSMPEPFFLTRSQIRRADEAGVISFKGDRYKIGRSFAKLPVGIIEDTDGILKLTWATYILAPIADFKM